MAAKLTNSTLLTSQGETKTLAEWAQSLGCPVQTLIGRLNRGQSIDQAVRTPIGSRGGQNRGAKTPAEVLTGAEMELLLEACSRGATGERNRALIVIGWRNGLRCFEALGLLPQDLDAQRQTIRVRHGKGDRARTVGLDVQAWEILNRWLVVRGGLGIADTAPLLCTLEGGPLDDRYVCSLMTRLRKAAGIRKRVHFHGLRHTMASELAAEGVPMHVIQQQLGHSNLAVTSRYINHLNPQETIAAMKARSWNGTPAPIANANRRPPPGWLDRLRAEIGESRLLLFQDSRQDLENVRAVVLLF
ncbi:MAG: tyrosine recombinase XerC [Schlesneria sp.]|nr:tyrosine recombinase XerC [Schlesneria sp.]